jgi:OOP family OmpA-OmpF porin
MIIVKRSGLSLVLVLGVAVLPCSALAQTSLAQNSAAPITVTGTAADALVAGPVVVGVINARSGDRVQIATNDGKSVVLTLTTATVIKGRKGPFELDRDTLDVDALLNGVPVTVKTWQVDNGLVANQISLRSSDLRIARMIRNGTAQRFAEQEAATAALRSRMGDIDNYNIKSTTNVYFASGKAMLTDQAKADLCSAAATADGINNALLLVVGYTDSTGNEEANQRLSEKRAGTVINYLQQACRWKPYRMLTPTGMASADPQASNDTPEGKAQNRRVSVNILVSKSVDGF